MTLNVCIITNLSVIPPPPPHTYNTVSFTFSSYNLYTHLYKCLRRQAYVSCAFLIILKKSMKRLFPMDPLCC